MRYLTLLLAWWCHAAIAQQDEWQNVSRVIAIGDLHGSYDNYIRILQMNALIDKRFRWVGGDTHLVQMGDIPDRGPDSLKIIRHLMKLDKEARRAGGDVHPLIGNHEAMNIEGDLRYVHPGEYSVLVNAKSKRLQAAWLQKLFKPDMGPTMEELAIRFPQGYVEHRQLWYPGQEIAHWVASNNTVIKINGVLFTHGGINPHQQWLPIGEINSRVREILSSEAALGPSFVNDENGPLWYRGLATNPPDVELEPLGAMLDYYHAARIVIAHTPTRGDIEVRFDGKVIMVDVGIGIAYGSHIANLAIEGQHYYSVKPEGKTALEVE